MGISPPAVRWDARQPSQERPVTVVGRLSVIPCVLVVALTSSGTLQRSSWPHHSIRNRTMNVQFQPQLRTAERRLPFECVALVLQGGGALGAYQAGVYEALAEANINPDWVAGVSIGAINSAIIAGNAPTERVGKLRAFWQEITANPLLDWAVAAHAPTPKGSLPRALFNQLSAAYAVFAGA